MTVVALRGLWGPLLSLYCCVFLFALTGHTYSGLSDDTLRSLPKAGNDFNIKNGALLSPILRPRVPGTPGSLAVLNHFIDFFKTSLPDWKMELHNASSVTPLSDGKEIKFTNFIASRDPPWARAGDVGRLTVVAHYDSLVTPEGFIGAIDSAAPCAIIMHVMRSIDAALTRKWAAMEAQGDAEMLLDEHQGIQVLFLDGEEAFKKWSDTDSLYGARALAEDWDDSYYPALSTYSNPLSSISLFVLLDLLGSKNPRVPSYFRTTHWAYENMAKLETRLRSLGQFRSSPNHESKRHSSAEPRAVEPKWLPDPHDKSMFGSFIEDDHIPFMARGVPIYHIIPSPFPDVWHNHKGIPDDGEHLDIETVEDWSTLVTAFVAEWMELEGHIRANDSTALPLAVGTAVPSKESVNAASSGIWKRKKVGLPEL